MFAVLKTGGKQYRVEAGDVLRVEKLAILHHVAHGVGVADVLERVPCQHDQVRQLADRERAQVLLDTEDLGTVDRRCPQHLEGRHAAHGERPHLPVVAQPLQLPVTPDRRTGAVRQELGNELGVLGEDVLFVQEPARGTGTTTRTGTAPPRTRIDGLPRQPSCAAVPGSTRSSLEPTANCVTVTD